MPKKKKPETQEAQSERFRAAVHQMIADGELNPIEADGAFEKLVKNTKILKTENKSDKSGQN